MTPPGYLVVAGTGSMKSFKWCGHEIDTRHLICTLDSSDVDFATPEREVHWVFLIPRELLANYLDEQAVEALRGRRILHCDPILLKRLFILANRAVSSRGKSSRLGSADYSEAALRADILEAVAQLVTGGDERRGNPARRQRYHLCRRAVAHAEIHGCQLSVPELASEFEVSRRTLERAFKDSLDLSPARFLRLHRLNHVHKALLSARARAGLTVTESMAAWGFTEFGRTSVEYKSLFGESPSSTLRKNFATPGLRLVDALVDG